MPATAIRNKPFACSRLVLLAAAFLISFGSIAHAGLLKPEIDFSSYDKSLYEQLRDHIRAKILARLGEGKNTRDRYFIIPFAFENKGNDPEFSHSFMSVIRVFADDRQPRLTAGLQLRTYRDREFEAFTISWLPHDFDTNPHLCVFEGLGARLDPAKNQCPTSVGKDFTLENTIKLCVNDKNAFGMWGPYEITRPAFDIVVKRLRLLESGKIKYRADDRLTRPKLIAINCFHAMAGLEDLYPNGGIFGTGFMMWGLNGTRRVLIEYKDRGGKRGLLLEPIDIKRDLYGFVYAPEHRSRGVYNPFEHASAYQK